MELFILMDAAFFGRGAFGVFSSEKKADAYRSMLKDVFCQWEIRKIRPIGKGINDDLVYVAYVYHELYDMYTLDGLYTDAELAKDAVGNKGLVYEFRIDEPTHRKPL